MVSICLFSTLRERTHAQLGWEDDFLQVKVEFKPSDQTSIAGTGTRSFVLPAKDHS